MIPRSRRLRLALLTLVPVALFLVVFGWLTWRQYERVRLRGPLIAAVKARDAGRVRDLLDRGADPNARDAPPAGPTGLRGLFLAMLGRMPSTPKNQGKTALMLAAGLEDVASVKLLLDRGADVNAKDQYGRTAMRWAAAQDFIAPYTPMLTQEWRGRGIQMLGSKVYRGGGLYSTLSIQTLPFSVGAPSLPHPDRSVMIFPEDWDVLAGAHHQDSAQQTVLALLRRAGAKH